MSNLPLIISVAALLISAAQFYYTHIRRRRAFYLVTISGVGRHMTPDFALINASSDDIIVSDLRYVIRKGSQAFVQAQQYDWLEGSSALIPKGKGNLARIIFRSGFTKSFVEGGSPTDSCPVLYEHHLYLEIEWLQADGNLNRKSVFMAVIGIHPDGDIRMISPRCSKIDLQAPVQVQTEGSENQVI